MSDLSGATQHESIARLASERLHEPKFAMWLAVLWLLVCAVGCGDLTAVACTLGEVGCPCLADERCADVKGERTVCVEGLCAFEPSEEVPCPRGTIDCPCTSDGACGARLTCTDVEGTGPECKPQAICPTGSLGCACYRNETCDTFEGETLRCDEQLCVRQHCEQGEAGCRCDAFEACKAGSVCISGMCERDTGQ